MQIPPRADAIVIYFSLVAAIPIVLFSSSLFPRRALLAISGRVLLHARNLLAPRNSRAFSHDARKKSQESEKSGKGIAVRRVPKEDELSPLRLLPQTTMNDYREDMERSSLEFGGRAMRTRMRMIMMMMMMMSIIRQIPQIASTTARR